MCQIIGVFCGKKVVFQLFLSTFSNWSLSRIEVVLKHSFLRHLQTVYQTQLARFRKEKNEILEVFEVFPKNPLLPPLAVESCFFLG